MSPIGVGKSVPNAKTTRVREHVDRRPSHFAVGFVVRNAREAQNDLPLHRNRTQTDSMRTVECSGFTVSKECPMNMNLTIGPLMALIAGILILIIPRLLNYIVALYLIVIGLLGLFGGNFNLK
jgi:hypothetical protein